MVVYHVFPGIDLAYHSVHTDCCCLGTEAEGDFIEICHCREGRMEQRQGNDFFYLMQGDLSIAKRGSRCVKYHFPLRHYHGISIVIDTDTAPECFSCFLKDVNVRPKEVAGRLCGEGSCCVIRSQDYVEHIFSELYAVPESYRKGYFKVKILELLLVLSGIDPMENSLVSLTLSKTQTVLAKKAAAYLAANIDRQVTVSELSEKFHASQTCLQNAFKGVYGVPVRSYNRILKMQSAALKLIHTDLTVLEIAGGCGYDNASKFALAFRRIMGESPAEYRRMHGGGENILP
ncbi:MAG: AraC family transcriptional regulator [Lachnospiraceae bacterium]|nr:AraC family transcriptional regulator [Muribaculaceae bacterium]MCM1412464.1 AraC family transcriptional regulator [Lachnospiraceae bacterium]MCM1542415.1 AraC family transcriptional regulator [Blautia sp.]